MGYVTGSLSVSYSNHATAALLSDLWVVTEGITYHIDDNTYVYVPQGYLTDGASVPRWVWSAIPPWGDHGLATVIHDYLCEYLQVWKNGVRVKISREDANKIFHKCLLDTGVSKLKARTMYTAVTWYSHLMYIVYYSYDPKKHEVEKYLLEQYKSKGIWL